MPSQISSDNNESYMYGMNESRTTRSLSVWIKTVNCMISWCTINQGCIHKDPNVTTKYGRIIQQLENYRNGLYSKYLEYKQRAVRVIESDKYGSESREFKSAEKQINNLCREIERMFDDAGHFFQALITKRFRKDEHFVITDVEVSGDDYDFDIEIADKRGSRYCIEVWQGKNKRHHARREHTTIMGDYNGKIHADRGSVPARLANVRSGRGGVSVRSKHDLPKIWKKLDQLPDNRTGFLIACRYGDIYPPNLGRTDFPIVPSDHIPPNKCIIVLNFVAGETSGTAFLIHHPGFKPEVAKKIIRSLKFKLDQNIYAEKKQIYKQYNLK